MSNQWFCNLNLLIFWYYLINISKIIRIRIKQFYKINKKNLEILKIF